MAKPRSSYLSEFWRQIVKRIRFEPSAQTIPNRAQRADSDDGQRDNAAPSAEREELHQLQHKIYQKQKISDNVHAEDTKAYHLSRLEERKKRLTNIRSRARLLYVITTTSCIILTFAVVFIIYKVEDNLLLIYTPVAYLAASFIIIAFARYKTTESEHDLQDIEFEVDLLQFDVSSRETRAEKVLRINDLQLRRYYSLNLRQNIWIFKLGIFCIFLGVGLIVITMYIIVVFKPDIDTKIITAVVGSIGSLLSSYIAAIYLKMHAAATSDLGSFHSRLVETHQLLLGSLLASRIEDDQKRWETLSQLALNMAKMSQ